MLAPKASVWKWHISCHSHFTDCAWIPQGRKEWHCRERAGTPVNTWSRDWPIDPTAPALSSSGLEMSWVRWSSSWLVIIETGGGLCTPLCALFWKQRPRKDIHNRVCFREGNLEGDVWAWPLTTCFNPGPIVRIWATAKGKSTWAVFPSLAS